MGDTGTPGWGREAQDQPQDQPRDWPRDWPQDRPQDRPQDLWVLTEGGEQSWVRDPLGFTSGSTSGCWQWAEEGLEAFGVIWAICEPEQEAALPTQLSRINPHTKS